MLDENIKPILGERHEAEAQKFLEKMEDVNSMLGELLSEDKGKVGRQPSCSDFLISIVLPSLVSCTRWMRLKRELTSS